MLKTRVLLINMPFAAVESPSLALGILKSGLVKKGIPCDVKYLNIDFARMIGMENYNFIVMSPVFFGGERVFAEVLYKNFIPDNNQYHAFAGKSTPQIESHLQPIRAQAMPFLQHCLKTIPWHQYDVIGFTSLFEQNLSSLALAYFVKQLYPNKIIIFGGANWEGIMGQTLHKCFPFVDYVCSGEADQTLPELIQRINYGHPVDDLAGIVYRRKSDGASVYTGIAPLTTKMDDLPLPDFDDYFQAVANSPFKDFLPQYLLFETSRGCWWGQKAQCMFCGLNGEHVSFRSKSSERILQEIKYLWDRYHVSKLRAADNALNPHYFKDLIPEMIRQDIKKNIQFTFEIRASLKKRQVKMLAEAGITIVQAGIENLCTHTLKLMNKGTDALTNIQLLKWSKQYGVYSDWNIIYGFPGEIPADYGRSHELAQNLTHLNPPTGLGPIRLDRFSPNYNRAKELGFINIKPMEGYKYIYPFSEEVLLDMIPFFNFDYKDKIDDGGFLQPFQNAVINWKTRQDKLTGDRINGQLVISDTRPSSTGTVLSGIEREIYEYCDSMRTPKQIEDWLQGRNIDIAKEKIEDITMGFVAKNLMVKENNQYLSLAVLNYPLEGE